MTPKVKRLDRLIAGARRKSICDSDLLRTGDRLARHRMTAWISWLYQSHRTRALLAIWRRLAAHYRDEPVVLGYDMLNEPIPLFQLNL